MENFNNEPPLEEERGVNMKKVMIATLYTPDAVLLAAHKIGPERIFLLINDPIIKEQEASLKLLKDSLGRVIEIKTIKIAVYDIVKIATKIVELIDSQPNDDHIYINITSGRKTQAIGALLAAYARNDRIKKIAYYPEEDKNTVVYLPKLSYNLNPSQRKVLDHLANAGGKSISELAEEIEISRAMLYKTIQELKDMDLVDTEEGIKLTDAGKIARL
ncbi:MAG: CRISPR-associated CARF protein Csa3 [Nanoarchaeota archaeon]